jgi:hypothetical protein
MSEQSEKMSLLQQFLSLDEVKKLQDQGESEELARLAISMGTIGRDRELRSYGVSLLKDEKKV